MMHSEKLRVPTNIIFIRMLDGFTVVQTLMGLIIPTPELSCNLWYEISTCFFFSSKSGLVLDMIIPKFSPQRSIGPFMGTTKDLNIYCTAIASSVATKHAQKYEE